MADFEFCSTVPPYSTPVLLPTIPSFLGADRGLEGLERQLKAWETSINTTNVATHAELVVAYEELSRCINDIRQGLSFLPIMPEIITPTTSRATFTDETGGVIHIDAGVTFSMRGHQYVSLNDLTLSQRQFTTTASKIYHCRWDSENGLRFIDTTDTTYNPSAKAETDTDFDTSFDDILLGRIVTNGSNVPTFTTLLNKADMRGADSFAGTNLVNSDQEDAKCDVDFAYNWSRFPALVFGLTEHTIGTAADEDQVWQPYPTIDRYELKDGIWLRDQMNTLPTFRILYAA